MTFLQISNSLLFCFFNTISTLFRRGLVTLSKICFSLYSIEHGRGVPGRIHECDQGFINSTTDGRTSATLARGPSILKLIIKSVASSQHTEMKIDDVGLGQDHNQIS